MGDRTKIADALDAAVRKYDGRGVTKGFVKLSLLTEAARLLRADPDTSDDPHTAAHARSGIAADAQEWWDEQTALLAADGLEVVPIGTLAERDAERAARERAEAAETVIVMTNEQYRTCLAERDDALIRAERAEAEARQLREAIGPAKNLNGREAPIHLGLVGANGWAVGYNACRDAALAAVAEIAEDRGQTHTQTQEKS